MKYKKQLIKTVADMFSSRKNQMITATMLPSMKQIEICVPTTEKPQWEFYLTDSPLDRHWGIVLHKKDLPFFMRKAGMYGLIFEKGICNQIGNAMNLVFLHVQIVEEEDCVGKRK